MKSGNPAVRAAPALRHLGVFSFAALLAVYLFLSARIGTGWLLPPWDKAAHFTLYGCLAALLWLGSGGRFPLLIALAVSMLGVADEVMQAGLPGRSADVADWAADTLSAVMVIAAMPRIGAAAGEMLLRFQGNRR